MQAQAQSIRRNYRPIGTFQIGGRRDGYRGGHSRAIRRAKLSNISLTTFATTPPTARSRFELRPYRGGRVHTVALVPAEIKCYECQGTHYKHNWPKCQARLRCTKTRAQEG